MRLAIDRVSKQYKNKIAVDRVSLKLEKGVYGLLGENGAGKTTLMRMICGVVRPDSGTISLDEMDAGQEAYRAVGKSRPFPEACARGWESLRPC